MTQDKSGLSRREALSLIAGGVAVTATAAALAQSGGPERPEPTDAADPTGAPTTDGEPTATKTPAARMPVAFVPHGGGPWPFADLGLPKAERAELTRYLERLIAPSP